MDEATERVRALGMALGSNSPDKWGGKPPLATCPACGEPLIGTTIWVHKEFVCICCGRLWGWVEPEPQEDTDERRARYEELLSEWNEAEVTDVADALTWMEETRPGSGKRAVQTQ